MNVFNMCCYCLRHLKIQNGHQRRSKFALKPYGKQHVHLPLENSRTEFNQTWQRCFLRGPKKLSWFVLTRPTHRAGVLRLFHVGLFHTVAPLCNSLRNDVASMETYSSWMNCPKEKCLSADLVHLFLVRFVTVRLTYIFIDYPDCEYIIILNTSIVIYDFWRLSVLRSSTPSMPIFGNRHRQKPCLLTNTRMIHTHLLTTNMILM